MRMLILAAWHHHPRTGGGRASVASNRIPPFLEGTTTGILSPLPEGLLTAAALNAPLPGGDGRRLQNRANSDFTAPHTGGGFTVTAGNYTAQLLADGTATRNQNRLGAGAGATHGFGGFGGAPLM